jgi:hypothetical protein
MLRQNSFFALCVALTAADCAWDASRDSDFITGASGEAVARQTIEQAQDIWPPNALDNDIIFDASRLLAPASSATAAPSPAEPSAASAAQ